MKQHIQNSPLVSVIVPNYNHARYLDRRLQTVLNQTYPNFEVWILDDKSTDSSLEVIAKYKDNPHIAGVIVNDKNSGSPFKQWDKGVSLAKGDIIWIAESDDYCELNFLEELVKAMLKKPNVVVAYSSYVIFTDDGYSGKAKVRKTQYFNGVHFIRCRMAEGNVIMNASGAIFTKKAFGRVRPGYKSYKSAGDYLFWVEMLAQGDVAVVNKNLTYFRLASTSVTGTNLSKGVTAMEAKKVVDYIETTFRLSAWQKWKAYAHQACTAAIRRYDNEQIRTDVLSLWHADKYSNTKLLNNLFWLQGSLERHFDILI